MPGVDPKVSVHRLYEDPHYKLIKQKKRTFSEEKGEAIREAPNGTWQMCTNFISINKACPKDYYPLPNIDRLVDSRAKYKVVDFLDAFRGYYQIFMAEEDVDKITFVTKYDIYCWKVMAFGLKNARATYQRMVNKVFSTHIGRNMEIYVDDMLIKIREEGEHETNLHERFDNLRRYKLWLNPDKLVFGMTFGKFPAYMISQRGIEPNPDKIAVVQTMQSPKMHKEVERLTRRIAALARFISSAGDRSLPFFKAIKKENEFEWTPECKNSFKELKAYLQSP
ncbi:hypothetical protein LIER_39079 [Lithospermum erythrorhizon]|uniref:Reverse transcriptase domain-containing protein n=1 Tax=Lithospermum erythrorhizon TaxID=34254 RepID=A0AAV3Q9C0_LITER